VTDKRDSRRWRHDMKNQLGIILGFSELLLDEMTAGDPRRQDLQEIHTAAGRAMTLLEEPVEQEAGADD
jgi:signal transduction histidine kinase